MSEIPLYLVGEVAAVGPGIHYSRRVQIEARKHVSLPWKSKRIKKSHSYTRSPISLSTIHFLLHHKKRSYLVRETAAVGPEHAHVGETPVFLTRCTALTERCPPRHKLVVERLKAEVEPLLS